MASAGKLGLDVVSKQAVVIDQGRNSSTFPTSRAVHGGESPAPARTSVGDDIEFPAASAHGPNPTGEPAGSARWARGKRRLAALPWRRGEIPMTRWRPRGLAWAAVSRGMRGAAWEASPRASDRGAHDCGMDAHAHPTRSPLAAMGSAPTRRRAIVSARFTASMASRDGTGQSKVPYTFCGQRCVGVVSEAGQGAPEPSESQATISLRPSTTRSSLRQPPSVTLEREREASVGVLDWSRRRQWPCRSALNTSWLRTRTGGSANVSARAEVLEWWCPRSDS